MTTIELQTEVAADRRQRHQSTRPIHQFLPGDLIFKRFIPQRHILDVDDLTAHRISLKLQDRYTGPHVVIRQLSPVTYRCSVNGRIQVVHLNQMKRNVSILHNVRDQRRDLFDDEDIVEERPTTKTNDYVTELRDTNDIILIEHDEKEEEEETYNFIDDSLNDGDEEQKGGEDHYMAPHMKKKNPRNTWKMIKPTTLPNMSFHRQSTLPALSRPTKRSTTLPTGSILHELPTIL
jgi:hypothetical protein